MSVVAMLWAMQPHDDLEPPEQLTLIVLADHANPDGCNAFPKVTTLAARRGVSARTIQRHLATLRRAGFIRYGDQRWTQHLRADERPTVWDLDLTRKPSAPPPDAREWDPDPSPSTPPEPVDDGVTRLSTPPPETGPSVDNRVATGVTSGVAQNQLQEPTTGDRTRVGDSPHAREAAAVDDEPCEHGDPRPRRCALCREARRVARGDPPPRRRRARPLPLAVDPRALAAGDHP